MYQLDDLKDALADLEAAVAGLHVDIDFTGTNVATAQGNFPEVDYEIEWNGNVVRATGKPLPVIITPATLAADFRQVLADVMTPDIEVLIQAVEDCSVAVP